MQLKVNGKVWSVPTEWQDDSLLHVLRGPLGMVGAKFGCGVGVCGACTVLIGDEAVRSCALNVQSVVGKEIITIEGLSREGEALHPVQQAWLDESVAQCGYCQAGQIMSAVSLLRKIPKPADADINDALDGNLCRCGTQQRIRRAVRRASGQAI